MLASSCADIRGASSSTGSVAGIVLAVSGDSVDSEVAVAEIGGMGSAVDGSGSDEPVGASVDGLSGVGSSVTGPDSKAVSEVISAGGSTGGRVSPWYGSACGIAVSSASAVVPGSVTIVGTDTGASPGMAGEVISACVSGCPAAAASISSVGVESSCISGVESLVLASGVTSLSGSVVGIAASGVGS